MTHREDLLEGARECTREIAARAEQMMREPMHRDEVAGVFMSLAQTLDFLITALGSTSRKGRRLMQYRQGDVWVERIEAVPDGARKVKRDRGRIVLAYGEVTGHAHAVLDRDAELLEVDGLEDRFLRVLAEGGVDVMHEEHATIALPPGSYRIRRQREYMPTEIRNVAD